MGAVFLYCLDVYKRQVGDEGKVVQMVHNDRQQRRYSGLRARLSAP